MWILSSNGEFHILCIQNASNIYAEIHSCFLWFSCISLLQQNTTALGPGDKEPICRLDDGIVLPAPPSHAGGQGHPPHSDDQGHPPRQERHHGPPFNLPPYADPFHRCIRFLAKSDPATHPICPLPLPQPFPHPKLSWDWVTHILKQSQMSASCRKILKYINIDHHQVSMFCLASFFPWTVV